MVAEWKIRSRIHCFKSSLSYPPFPGLRCQAPNPQSIDDPYLGSIICIEVNMLWLKFIARNTVVAAIHTNRKEMRRIAPPDNHSGDCFAAGNYCSSKQSRRHGLNLCTVRGNMSRRLGLALLRVRGGGTFETVKRATRVNPPGYTLMTIDACNAPNKAYTVVATNIFSRHAYSRVSPSKAGFICPPLIEFSNPAEIAILLSTVHHALFRKSNSPDPDCLEYFRLITPCS